MIFDLGLVLAIAGGAAACRDFGWSATAGRVSSAGVSAILAALSGVGLMIAGAVREK
jgi:hypothetical protein